MHAVDRVALALGVDLSADRKAAISAVLHKRLTEAELAAAVEHIIFSESVAEKLRYGGTITPSDFLVAKAASLSSDRRDRHNLPSAPPGSVDGQTMRILLDKGWHPEDFRPVGATYQARDTYEVVNPQKLKTGVFVPWIRRPIKS